MRKLHAVLLLSFVLRLRRLWCGRACKPGFQVNWVAIASLCMAIASVCGLAQGKAISSEGLAQSGATPAIHSLCSVWRLSGRLHFKVVLSL
jgi:hypothetical protein